MKSSEYIPLSLLLQKLPEYSPSEEVWEAIVKNLENSSATSVSPGDLPSYSPSPAVWDKISSSLDEPSLKGRLKSYGPPAEIWSAIEGKLNNTDRKPKTPIKAFRLAAVIVILIAAAFLIRLFVQDSKTGISQPVTAHEMGQSNFKGFHADGLSGAAFIKQLCLRSQDVCESPEFKRLQGELEELEQARAQVKENMSPYVENGKLEQRLMKIEIQHAKIIKQMAGELS
jgi:hypothetical protein